MEAMLGISLCSYPYLSKNALSFLLLLMSSQKFSNFSTKLEKRAEQVLPGSERGWGQREGVGGSGGEKCPKHCMHI
jgi:hypothetical protein